MLYNILYQKNVLCAFVFPLQSLENTTQFVSCYIKDYNINSTFEVRSLHHLFTCTWINKAKLKFNYNNMNLDWDNEFKITIPMASSKKLPPHVAVVGKSKIHGNKKHGPCTFELARTTIWKDPMLLVNNPTPMHQQAMLNKNNVMFFVITNMKMGFVNYFRFIVSLLITKFASRLYNIMHILSCILITWLSCWQCATFYNYLLILFFSKDKFQNL